MSGEDQAQPNRNPMRRLWNVLGTEALHAEAGNLGQYASILHQADRRTADREFPLIGRHLSAGCQRCRAMLNEILAFLAARE